MSGVVAVVPARGGSKSLPHKNLRLLGGVPLVVHAIRQALAAGTVDRVIVSTDSPEIAAVAAAAGAEVPFLRPAEFATDTATDLQVFRHLLNFLSASGESLPDLLVQIRATSPLRRPEVIDLAVRKILARPDATSLRSVSPASFPPYKMWSLLDDSKLTPVAVVEDMVDWYDQPRQALPAAYAQDGLIDIIRPATILRDHSMAGPVILGLLHPERAVDIDTAADLKRAEAVLAEGAMKAKGPRPLGVLQGRLTVPWNGELQCFPRGAWAKEFSVARDLGLDAIELIVDSGPDNPVLDDRETARLSAVSKENGVALQVACVDYLINEDLRAPATARWLSPILPRLARAGVTNLVLPLFGASELSAPGAMDEMLWPLRRLADEVGRHGLRLCLECGLPGSALYEYLGRLSHDLIGICYDTGNTTALGHDTEADAALLAPLVWHVHVKDKDERGANVLLGTGRTPLAGILGVLLAGGDWGMSLETTRGADPRQTAADHMRLVRRLESEANR